MTERRSRGARRLCRGSMRLCRGSTGLRPSSRFKVQSSRFKVQSSLTKVRATQGSMTKFKDFSPSSSSINHHPSDFTPPTTSTSPPSARALTASHGMLKLQAACSLHCINAMSAPIRDFTRWTDSANWDSLPASCSCPKNIPAMSHALTGQ